MPNIRQITHKVIKLLKDKCNFFNFSFETILNDINYFALIITLIDSITCETVI